MAFLKYRREVVLAWPDSPRKGVFLTGIESRLATVQQQLQRASASALDTVERSLQIETEQA